MANSHAVAVLVMVAACVTQSFCFDVGFGSCPDKPVVKNFNIQKYMGEWYEIERFWQFFEWNGKCSKANYTLDPTSGKVLVKNSMIVESSGEEKSIEGTAEQVTPSEGKLAVTFKIPVIGARKAPYWVIDTDYNNYALVYSCSSYLGLLKVESAWILSRTKTSNSYENIEAAVKKADIRRASFSKTVQDC